ncbi:hypothetical protein [Cohnella zeiphila]|uniref:HTH iclR-type domain-containing protein n=1 Tax=Cohnella zeiphila TaxID=2761120 RepID=A0A7X0SJL7_9BACL|nr:hypothetical protein [Cohnella zeiphila]MBB6731195.1 hypothetical protein [Cohnella zeiphila]
MVIEADGFGPHWRDISRWQFDGDLERQNLLLIAGWKMLRFSYDGIMEKPLRCQQTLLLSLAKWGQLAVEAGRKTPLNVYERAILHFALSFEGEKMTPSEVARELGISSPTAITYMQALAEKVLASRSFTNWQKNGICPGFSPHKGMSEESNQITHNGGETSRWAKESNQITHIGGETSRWAEESKQITHIGGETSRWAKESNQITHIGDETSGYAKESNRITHIGDETSVAAKSGLGVALPGPT